MLLARIPSKMKFFLRIVSIRDVFIVLQIGGFFFSWLGFTEKYKQYSPKYFWGTGHIQSLYMNLKNIQTLTMSYCQQWFLVCVNVDLQKIDPEMLGETNITLNCLSSHLNFYTSLINSFFLNHNNLELL